MFKQPAENTNATAAEERRSSDRVHPESNIGGEPSEIEAEARRLAAERGSADSISEEDWNHASRIVRNRNIALSKA